MKRASYIFFLLALVVSQAVKPAAAQGRNEVGLLLGARVASDPGVTPNLQIGKSLAYQLTYAHWFLRGEGAAVALEIPFAALPSQDINSSALTAPRNFAAIYVTPGIRVKLAPSRGISPWASVGGGYARFDESSTLLTGSPNPFTTGTNKGALQFGGGVDLRAPAQLLLPISFRVEVRDFYSGQPRFNAITTSSVQHNVLVSGGLVLRF